MQTPFAIYDALTSIEVPPEKVRVVVQSMEHDMALFASRSQFDQLDQFSGSRHDLLRAEMASFREHTDERFEQVRGEIAALAKHTDERFEQVRGEIAALAKHTDERFDRVYAEIAALAKHTDERFESIENRLVSRLGKLMVATVTVATALIGTLVTVLAVID